MPNNDMPKQLKEYLAKIILTHGGYRIIQTLGQGGFNVVFKCVNPKNELVAAKVTVSYFRDKVLEEAKAGLKIDALAPPNWEKLSGLFTQYEDAIAAKNRQKLKKSKQYYKYLNRPSLQGTSSIKPNNRDVYYAVFEAPLANRDSFNKFCEELKKVNTNFLNYENKMEDLRRAAKSAAKGLRALHEKGFVHLDVKPSNIFVIENAGKSGKDRYQLSDFGLATKAKSVKKSGGSRLINFLSGTPGYAAPEQKKYSDILSRGANLQVSSEEIMKMDSYSLGATLFRMYLSAIYKEDIPSTQIFDRLNRLRSEYYVYMSNVNLPDGEMCLIDLICRLTRPNPNDRISVKDSLNHSFFKKPINRGNPFIMP